MLHRIILLLLILCPINATARAATIQLPRTGQTTCYDDAGNEINPCTGTGQDGDKLAGAVLPSPRFTDNTNGTVTDNLTGLIWLKNANCTDTAGGIEIVSGDLTWSDALTWSNALASGTCGLADNSVAGDWRLPNIVELKSLMDLSNSEPALPNGGNRFSDIQLSWYWSSSSFASDTDTKKAWLIDVSDGYVYYGFKILKNFAWPVRGGQ